MSNGFCIGIDVGTSSTKICLLDERGDMRWAASEPHSLISPRSDYVEVDPRLLVDNAHQLLNRLAQEINEQCICAPGDVRTVALANQRETVVFWRRSTGECLRNAIVWSDRRTEAICTALTAKYGSADHFKPRNGLVISTYFSAFKLLWALENGPEVRRANAEGDLLVGTVDCWMMFKLLEGSPHVTDAYNASRTFLFNLSALDWDDEILGELGLGRAILPAVRDSYACFGRLAEGAFRGAELRAVLGDQQAAAFGAGALDRGDCSVVFGTGTFLTIPIGRQLLFSPDFLTTVLYQCSGRAVYAFEGSAESGGSNVAYIVSTLPLIGDVGAAATEAAALPPSAMRRHLYFLGTLNGALGPHWRSEAAGAVVGLRLTDRPLDLFVAALEGIVFRLKENLDLMGRNGLQCQRLCLAGGLSQADYLTRFLVQLEGRAVLRAKSPYSTAIGTAMLGLKGAEGVEALAAFDRHLSLLSPAEDSETTEFLLDKYSRFKQLMEFNCMFFADIHE